MKITMENFNYKGHHFEDVTFELPSLKEVDDVFEEKIISYMVDTLDNLIEIQEDES